MFLPISCFSNLYLLLSCLSPHYSYLLPNATRVRRRGKITGQAKKVTKERHKAKNTRDIEQNPGEIFNAVKIIHYSSPEPARFMKKLSQTSDDDFQQ